MFNLKRPLDGAAGLLLLIALLCLGALFGVSFAMLTRAVAGETLPQRWGSALGAGIGATATLLAATYNQRATERREKQRALNEVLIPMLDCTYALIDVHNLSGRIHRNRPGERELRPELREKFEAASKHCVAIKQTPGLSEKTNEQLSGGRLHLEYIFRMLGQAVATAERSNDVAHWNAVQDECNNGILALDDIQKKLKATL